MQEFVTKVNGQKDQFVTGAVRGSQEGKLRYDLVGLHGLKREAALLARGAEHYGERNWEKGQPVARTAASLLRHIFAYIEGDRSEDHIAALRFNAGSIAHVEEEVLAGRLPAELLDYDWYKALPGFADRFEQTYDSIFERLTDLEGVVLGYMDKAQKQNTVGIYWFDFHTVWHNTLPTLSEKEFADVMRRLIEKLFVHPEIVPNKVHPNYALAGYISYLEEQERHAKLAAEEPKADWDYDSTEYDDFDEDDCDCGKGELCPTHRNSDDNE